MRKLGPRNQPSIRLSFEETVTLQNAVAAGMTNKQIIATMPRVTKNNIYFIRKKLGIMEYKRRPKFVQVNQVIQAEQPVEVQQPIQSTSSMVSYSINGINIQVSVAPKSINIKDNSFTLEF